MSPLPVPARWARRVTACVTALFVSAAVAAGAAPHAVAAPSHDTAHIIGTTEVSAHRRVLDVHSPAVGRTVPLTVLLPATAGPHPVLYLLNGAGGGEDGANWLSQTDVEEFFADEDVIVVIPGAGIGSYYTDWVAEDPAVGAPRWETFLTAELPVLLADTFGTTGANAIAGLSMSATSVLDLATRHPDLYDAVASYSGCARTSTPAGEAAVRTVVAVAAGADATHMWGPPGDPRWETHDPYLNAEKLRGTAIYVSSGDGTPGPYDVVGADRPHGSPPLEEQLVVGGLLEAAARTCTVDLADRLRELSIPATFHLPSYGTHSWRYWQDELHRSWPLLAAAIGAGS